MVGAKRKALTMQESTREIAIRLVLVLAEHANIAGIVYDDIEGLSDTDAISALGMSHRRPNDEERAQIIAERRGFNESSHLLFDRHGERVAIIQAGQIWPALREGLNRD